MNGDREKYIGGIDFEELKSQRIQVYKTLTIDLSQSRWAEERTITGTYVYILESTDMNANLDIQFNEIFRSKINFTKGRGIRCPFYRIYISNEAQAGKTITLAIGIESPTFEIFDKGKALGITGTVDVNQVGGIADLPAGATQIVESEFRIVSSQPETHIFHTVSAGKTFHLCSANMTVMNSSGAAHARMDIRDASDVVKYCLINIFFPASGTKHETWQGFTPLKIPEAYDIILYCTTNGDNVHGFIHGYEV